MKKLRLFEWHEQSWVPPLFRQSITAYLSVLLKHYKMYSPITPLLAKLVKLTGRHKLFDFCSGGTGMLTDIQKELFQKYDVSVEIEFTDKFPDAAPLDFTEIDHGLLAHYQQESIDVIKYKKPTEAIRTLFTSFHHFKPLEAKRILQNAVDSRDPIAIFEFTQNQVRRCLFDLVVPISVMQLVPRIKPSSRWRLFFTYVIPLITLTAWWDSMVSNFRTYSVKQLEQLVSEVSSENYHWELGVERAGLRFYQITYLLGWPKQSESDE